MVCGIASHSLETLTQLSIKRAPEGHSAAHPHVREAQGEVEGQQGVGGNVEGHQNLRCHTPICMHRNDMACWNSVRINPLACDERSVSILELLVCKLLQLVQIRQNYAHSWLRLKPYNRMLMTLLSITNVYNFRGAYQGL